MKIFRLGMILLSLLFLSSLTFAQQIFDPVYQYQNKKLVLKGSGPEYFFFIKVFNAAFYIDETVSDKNYLGDTSKRLEVLYAHAVPGKRLAQETRRRIISNTTKEEFEAIRKRVDQMDNYFIDLKPGDRYALTYICGVGTIFSYNSRVAGTITGADFAKALFAVWIGEHPINQNLKKNLIGLER